MAFHVYDLGPVSARLQRYADMDGLVPEAGNRWSEFHWTHREWRMFADRENGQIYWERFLSETVVATTEALEVLERLHDANSVKN